MSAKKQALGRGLSALLPDSGGFEASGERVQLIASSQIHANPDQPRKSFDPEKLAELAASIRSHGVMQPLIVVRDNGGYLIAAGERRFRAAALAGMTELPCIVRKLDQRQLSELSLLENIQREDLSPLEEAAALQGLLDDHGYTQEDLAARLGKSRSHLANTLRLLKLAAQDKKLLAEGRISAGHARALLAVPDPRRRAQLTSAILRDHLSVRQAEELATRLKQAKPAAKPAKNNQRQLIHQDLARRCSARLGVPVRLEGGHNKGRLVIEYNSEDDLQNIIELIVPEVSGE